MRSIMRTQLEKEYLLKAVDTFKRKLFVISKDYIILSVNQRAFETEGEDLINQKCYYALKGEKKPCDQCPVDEVVKTGKSILMNHQFLDSNCDTCRYFCPILSDNEVEAIVSMDFGIPILEGLEEKLQRSNAILRNLIQSAVDAILAVDINGKIIIFNDAAAEISGYSVDEALSSLDIRSVYPNDGAREIMRKLRSDEYGGKGKLKSYKVDIIRKDGEIIPISVNAALIHEGEKEIASIGFFHDLRESIRISKELEKTQLQLLQAEKMASLGKLAAGVAHQLNNPLGGITLFTKLVLEEYDLEQGARDDLKRILKDAERCRDTVKELLEFARQTRHLMRPHDINRAISRTLFLLENQTIFHNIQIEKQLADNLPEVQVDIQQLNHVFMNIILNAADAMEGRGLLTVKTELLSYSERVRVEIHDSGPGIPQDVIPHIFEPFFTTKEEGKGTGLGLSMVYGIVENHGGTIIAKNYSDNGGGASFIIELPIQQA